MTLGRKLSYGAGIVAVVVIGAGGARALQSLGGRERELPTIRVQRGNLELKVYTTGELRPARTAQILVPPVSGSLQIVSLLKTGTLAKEGDVVIEFDPSEQEYNLEQSKSQVQQAEQEIIKAKSDADVQTSEDQVALLHAKFDVRRAELEVGRNELVSAIDAKKNVLNLEEAKRRLEQIEKDSGSRKNSNDAALAVLIEKRNRERLNMQQAQQNISNLVVKAPFSGLVAVKDNRDASGGFFTTGMVLPEYRPGDQVSSGRFIAEILEVSTMEILSKVGEGDRGNISPGQPVEVHVDTLAGAAFNGKVKTVAGMASRGDMWGGDGTRKFDATFQLDKPDDRLRPGVTAQIIILGEAIKNALFLPRQAIFEREGKPVVYVRKGNNFEPQEIKIAKRNESQVVIEGLPEGTEVALANPEKMKKSTGKGPTAGPSLGGAGGK